VKAHLPRWIAGKNKLFHVFSVFTLIGNAVAVKGDTVTVMQSKGGRGALSMCGKGQVAKGKQQNGGCGKDFGIHDSSWYLCFRL
jgi:hypothetical protein